MDHKLNNKISKLHERCLGATYEDHKASFEEFLEKDNSVSVHYKNLQCHAIELCNVFNGISPNIIRDVFKLHASFNYDIRDRSIFYLRPINSVYYGTDSLSIFIFLFLSFTA